MDTKEYQRLAVRTLATTEPKETMKLCLIGMQGELGEIAEPIKKYLYSGHALDVTHIEKEVGDFLWYLANLCNELEIDLESAMQRNIKKLEQRYPDGFSRERSLNRRELQQPCLNCEQREALYQISYCLQCLRTLHLQVAISQAQS